MILDHPLIIKELIQASHKRHMYWLRTSLPAIATIVLVFAVGAVLVRSHGDWRSIAGAARPLFVTCAWMQLIVFSLMAGLYAAAGIRNEWRLQTMEVLRTTPISFVGVVYGKFAGMAGRILMMALALLPVSGVWLHFGRIPKEMVLGSAGVVAGSTVLFGALGTLESSMSSARGPGRGPGILPTFLYLMVMIAGAFLPCRITPLFIAAVPPWAFHYVMAGTTPAKALSPGQFALMAIVIPLALGAYALAAAPFLFRRACDKAFSGGSNSDTRRRRAARRRRPPLRPAENPFAWQEKGERTRVLSWGLWITYAVAVVLVTVICAISRDWQVWREPMAYGAAAMGGALAMTLMGLSYGADVFAREKARRTAQALVLTGNPPAVFYKGKLRALVRAFRFSYLGIVFPLVIPLFLGAHIRAAYVQLGLAALVVAALGPPLAALTAMVFSAAAHSPRQVVLAIVLTPLIAALTVTILFPCFVVPYMLFAAALGGVLLMIFLVHKWTVWRVGLMFTLTLFALIGAVTTILWMTLFAGALFTDATGPEYAQALWVLGAFTLGAAGLIAYTVFWYKFGARIFDGCMTAER